MNIKRMIFTLVMAAALIMTFLPASVFAEGETVKPVAATILADLEGYPGEEELTGLYEDSARINVEYSDGSSKDFVYGTYTYKDEKGNDQSITGFMLEDGDPSSELSFAQAEIAYEQMEILKEGSNEIRMRFNIPYAEEDGTVSGVILESSIYKWISVSEPLSVRFEPAEGFVISGFVGYNIINEEAFYGEGNKFYVQYATHDDPEYVTPADGSIEVEYDYVRQETEDGVVEGFYDGGNIEYEKFDLSDGFDCYLNKGMNEVELTYYAIVRGLDDIVELNFKVDVDAQKYYAYTIDSPIYSYTGKAIKPSFKVYNSADEKIPAKEYTFKAPKNKKLGWYDVKITFKDAYKDKYKGPFYASYGIGPRRPVIRKVSGGKKSLTVVWKKFTSAQLKKIDYIKIRVSKDKNFMNGVKTYTVKGKVLKSGRKVIKKLQKGKKYYVEITAYKKIKQNGQKFAMPSRESAVKYAKTK